MSYQAIGYQAPTRQPLRLVRIGPFDLQIGDRIDHIDARLELLFGSDWDHIEPAACRPLRVGDPAALAWQVGERILAIAAYLLRSARIPAMTSGRLSEARVLATTPPQRWVFSAEIPNVDGVPPRISNSAYENAIRTLRWCSGISGGCSASDLQDELERRFVKPAGRTLQETGKSGIYVAMGAFLADIPFTHIGSGLYLLGWGSKAVLTHRSSIGTDSVIGCKIATSKSALAELLKIAGLPAPQHQLAGSEDEAVKASERLAWPLVVKPNDRERGEGVTVGIHSVAQLRQAFTQARRFSQRVLVEKHVDGVCHRVMVVRGRVLLVVKRNPQQVEGDGCRSISALIDAKNLENQKRPPWARSTAWPPTAEINDWLTARGSSPESVPCKGEVVPLRPFESATWGGHSEYVTELIHPENADICVRAAALLDIDVAGVDLITPDISVPWTQNGGVINEVNHAPFFAAKPERKHLLRDFVTAIMPEGGRIPVDLVIGRQKAVQRGVELQRARCASGERCFMVTKDMTLRPDGSVLPSPFDCLYQRTRSLLVHRAMDSMVMVAQDDRLLATGLPIDRIEVLDTSCIEGEDWASGLAVWAQRFKSADRA